MHNLAECPSCGASAERATRVVVYRRDWNDSHLGQPRSLRQWISERVLGRARNAVELVMVRCLGCGHRFNNPQLSWRELEEYYGSGYNCFEDPAAANGAASGAAEASEFQRIKVVPGGRFLDVGCGVGHLVAALAELGMDAYGVEPSEYAVARATALGRRVQRGMLGEVRFEDAWFDSMSLHHVLEHTPDPRQVLAECARILKPGGFLTVAVPNADSLVFAWLGGAWNMLEPGHLQHFSQESLLYVAKRSELVPVHVETESIPWAIELGITQWLRTRLLIPQSVLLRTHALRPLARAIAARANASGRGEAIIVRFQKPA